VVIILNKLIQIKTMTNIESTIKLQGEIEITKLIGFLVRMADLDKGIQTGLDILDPAAKWSIIERRHYAKKGGIIEDIIEETKDISKIVDEEYSHLDKIREYKENIEKRFEKLNLLAKPYFY